MLVRARPTVMISSTIKGLENSRQKIADGLEASGLADGWLFELHATASGAPAEERYLDLARACDLYVIIVAGQGSPATESEYRIAYEDNPRKVLPFFVGGSTPDTIDLRSLIDSRHTRVRCDDPAELAPKVLAAIIEQVRSGELVRTSLLEALDERLRRGERVVRAALPLGFVPSLTPTPDVHTDDRPSRTVSSRLATSVTATSPHVALEGIGGSGKTYGALAMLRHACSGGILPIVVHPTTTHLTTESLIAAAFEGTRFFPGEGLMRQLAHDGRLGIVIDGIDGLGMDERRIFLRDVNDFAQRFPRSLLICCVRRVLPQELGSFDRFTLDPLTDQQTRDMFRAVNAPELREFPTQVADLARWPLWAWALLEVGPDAATGLVLLRKLLEHRINSAGAYSALEAQLLNEAAAALAFHSWPLPSLQVVDALAAIAAWAATPAVRTRFAVPAAETVIQRLSEAGIVQLTPDVVFAHPLFATYLAARHAAVEGATTLAMADDPEFAVFVAAFLSEDRADEKLQHLLAHGPVGQARYLRLVPEVDRTTDAADPLLFGEAVRTLTGTPVTCIVTDNWTAWRSTDQPVAATKADIAKWLLDGDLNFFQGNVFKHRSPVDVAAIESLAQFKYKVLHLRPEGDRFHQADDASLSALSGRPRAELEELILRAAMDWRLEWRRLTAKMGLTNLPDLRIDDGDPQVTVYEQWPDPRVSLNWGTGSRVTWAQPNSGPQWLHRPLSQYLEPGRTARIYQEVVNLAELALGCTFGSQTWRRPQLVAAWAW